MQKLCFIDTETTGIFPESQLLTACLKIGCRYLDLALKSSRRSQRDNGLYVIEPEAMKVNGIDLLEHDRSADTLGKCTNKLKTFLNQNTRSFLGTDPETRDPIIRLDKVVVVGHSVEGDIDKLVSTFNTFDFAKYFEVESLCTKRMAADARLAGLLPEGLSISLQSLAKYFDIEHKQAHTARGDVETTEKVYYELLRIIRVSI